MTTEAFPELQALATKLIALPPADVPASKLPTVYGYVSAEQATPGYADACADVLTWWSVARGWRLSLVFRDIGIESTALIRPGFTAATDVLRLPEASGLLVISHGHLSPTRSVADRLALAVRRTGTTLRILADELVETPT
ncbi:recombinase family protein [Amycolatopsis sp. H20-H5]|uniref:recombinase family protein n=1 Tax=Amycolatopsis sp. H20-H5 TaxID=3046309 RepID=UPI002DBF39A6|nr:recombinase family protein [Amycolatopsis sp. H20-H5]MEC3978159.1 recombinase family protein [Amycolatopsis sp. H20-H5]